MLDRVNTKFSKSLYYNPGIEIAKYIYEEDKNVLDIKDWYGRTALHYAAQNSHRAFIQYFIHMVEFDEIDQKNMSPFYLAIISRNEGIIEIFLQENVDMIEEESLTNYNAFQLACLCAPFELIKKIFSKMENLKNFSANKRTKEGLTALHIAVNRKSYDICSWLLKLDEPHRVDATATWNKNNLCPFLFSIYLREFEIMKLILEERKNDLTHFMDNKLEPPKYSALHIMALLGNETYLKYLIDLKFPIDLDYKNRTPYKLSVEMYRPEEIQKILQEDKENEIEKCFKNTSNRMNPIVPIIIWLSSICFEQD